MGVEAFDTLLDAKVLIERRRKHSSTIRPHSAGLLEGETLTWNPVSFIGKVTTAQRKPTNMTRYKVLETRNWDLREILEEYRGEVGKSGHREGTMRFFQLKLEEAMNNARGFQVANRSPQSTDAKGVKALAAFHASQQTHVKQAEQARLNEVAIRLRTWISRQGAWFSGASGLHWDQTMRSTVVYDCQLAQQNATKLSVIGGLLFAPDGTLFDTSRMVTCASGPGYAIYVMSAEGNLHVSSHSVGHRHHSSLLGGAAVAGAGEIQAAGGRITFLSNKSGHYHPERRHLLAVLAMLQHRRVSLNFRVLVIPGNKRYGSVDAFMNDNQLDNASIDQAVRDAAYFGGLGKYNANDFNDPPNSALKPYENSYFANDQRMSNYDVVDAIIQAAFFS